MIVAQPPFHTKAPRQTDTEQCSHQGAVIGEHRAHWDPGYPFEKSDNDVGL